MAARKMNSRNKRVLRIESLEDRRMLAGPKVIAMDFVDTPEGERFFDVLFDQELQASTATLRNIELSLLGGQRASVEFMEPDRIRLDMSAGWDNGHYHLTVGPNISNLAGERMDGDEDGIAGEAFQDEFFFHFDLDEAQGPVVYMFQNQIGGPSLLSGFDLTFDAPIDAETFDANDLRLLDSRGNSLNVEPTIVRNDSFSFSVSFAGGIDESGEYILHVGPDISDLNGNAMDESLDGVFGGADDSFVKVFSVYPPRPIPTTEGSGVFVELFLDVNELFQGNPVSQMLKDRSPDATSMATAIDFPNDAEDVLIWEEATLGDFFTESTTFADEVTGLLAANFMLRHHFFLPARAEYDLDPSTPEIDIRVGVASDDGFILTINDEFIGFATDRGFRYSWYEMKFPSEGLYPIELVYSANERNESGLELGWETAVSGGEQVVPTESLYFDTSLLTSGDINLDGSVDSTDLGLLLNNFGDDSGKGWSNGNLNDDAFIDSTDLGLLLNRFGFPYRPAASALVATAESDAADIDRDGTVSPLDVLRIVNFLNAQNSGANHIDVTPTEFLALDVDKNGEIAPLDALLAVNRLEEHNRRLSANSISNVVNESQSDREEDDNDFFDTSNWQLSSKRISF